MFCLPLGNGWLLVELKENEFGPIPEENFSVGGTDFGGADVFAVSVWVRAWYGGPEGVRQVRAPLRDSPTLNL